MATDQQNNTTTDKRSEEKKDEFRQALQTARAKAVAGRAILDLARVPDEEAVGCLHTGWRQIIVALTHATGRVDGQGGATILRRALAREGLLRRIKRVTFDDIEALGRAFEAYRDGAKIDLSPEMCRKLADALEYAVLYLEDFQRKHRASRGQRAWFLTRRFLLIAVGIVVVVGIVVGLVLTLKQPEKNQGLSATYFTAVPFKGHPFKRVDPTINFAWGQGSPLRGVPRDRFSVRWEGCIHVEKGQPMYLVAGSDDGIRVYVDQQEIINNWGGHPYQEKWATKPITPGVHQIRVEYYEAKSSAKVYLGWSERRGGRHRVVAHDHLIPVTGNARFKCPYRWKPPAQPAPSKRAKPEDRPQKAPATARPAPPTKQPPRSKIRPVPQKKGPPPPDGIPKPQQRPSKKPPLPNKQSRD